MYKNATLTDSYSLGAHRVSFLCTKTIFCSIRIAGGLAPRKFGMSIHSHRISIAHTHTPTWLKVSVGVLAGGGPPSTSNSRADWPFRNRQSPMSFQEVITPRESVGKRG